MYDVQPIASIVGKTDIPYSCVDKLKYSANLEFNVTGCDGIINAWRLTRQSPSLQFYCVHFIKEEHQDTAAGVQASFLYITYTIDIGMGLYKPDRTTKKTREPYVQDT